MSGCVMIGDWCVFVAVSQSEIPKPNRLSTFRGDAESDLFISKESLVGFQVIDGG